VEVRNESTVKVRCYKFRFGSNQDCNGNSSIFGSKGSVEFVKVLEPSICSCNSMCNFEKGGLCCFMWSFSFNTCLNCRNYT